MTFCLDSTIIRPENNAELINAIILFHGYGGDGKDISMLSMGWKRYLPNTIFICPNGHEPCSINPSGFQWFDLTKDDTKYILEQSIEAEKKINLFIDEIKKEFNLENNRICLSGFSQGCMMILNLFVFVSGEVNDTIELMLAGKNGKWKGSGISDVREFKHSLKKEKSFSKKGKYSINIEQAMRYGASEKIQHLPNILDVGLIIKKAK